MPQAIDDFTTTWARISGHSRGSEQTTGSAKLAHKALHCLIATGKTVLGEQVLPDGFAIAPTSQALFDQLARRFADTW